MKFFGKAPPQNGSNGDSTTAEVFHLREVGLVTGQYLAQRCEEECYRAERYQRPLSIMVVEPKAGAPRTTIRTSIGRWLAEGVRMTDVAAYLGGGRYAVLLPETDGERAWQLATRIEQSVQYIRTGVSSFPQDGRNFAELVASAKEELLDNPMRRAA